MTNDSKTVEVVIDTDVEAYPVLSIREPFEYELPSEITVPVELMTRLDEAREQEHQAELAIMRYVGERWPYEAIREWLDDHDKSQSGVDPE